MLPKPIPSPWRHIAISRDPRAHLLAKLLRAGLRPSQWARTAGRAANGIAVSRTKPSLEKAGLSGVAKARFHFVEHHRAHMASAFFPSPFEEAAVISVDGFGDFSSVMWGVGRGNQIEVRGGVRFPHSLGLFYTAFTQFLGFPKYGDEYKMMGLRLTASRASSTEVRDIVRHRGRSDPAQPRLFRHHNEGVEMTWEGGEPALGRACIRRSSWSKIRASRAMPRCGNHRSAIWISRLPRSRLEEIYFALLNYVQKQTGLKAVASPEVWRSIASPTA